MGLGTFREPGPTGPTGRVWHRDEGPAPRHGDKSAYILVGPTGGCRRLTPMTSPDPVLITGCSSGIGEATALMLVRAGHTVYATARRPETLADLEIAGARILALDVTDEESMAAAVKAVEDEHGS